MKKTIFAIALGFATIFCGCQNKAEQTASNEEPKLQTGDLVFVALPLDYMSDTTEMGSAIAASTGDSVGINYIHVAIAEVANDSVWIIDATLKHGVDNAAKYVENAKQFTGRDYDLYFLPDNDEQYCSELVRNSYIDEKGEHLFSDAPMNFKSDDGTFPPYWVWLFEQIGQPIPQGLPGTNPNAMSKEKCLKKVDIDIKKYSTAK